MKNTLRVLVVAFVFCCGLAAFARPVCVGEMCYPSEQAALDAGVSPEVIKKALAEEHVETPTVPNMVAPIVPNRPARLAMGYMKPPELLAFLRNEKSGGGWLPNADQAWWLILLLVLLGGLGMNLTPCVLPMVPINLMIIGKSATRGALYGLGIALAYGAMGLLAALGGMAFGEIQGSPWFNAAIAVLFVLLSLALLDVFYIDFSKRRAGVAQKSENRFLRALFPFVMGAVSAVLAGACVAPVLIAVLLLTADLTAKGVWIAAGLPFVLGLGMALPWPFAGAGLKVLPKPGAWMKRVNKLFGVLVLGFAVWYAHLAWTGFKARLVPNRSDVVAPIVPNRLEATPATWEKTFAEAKAKGSPVFVDVWATWCKNCLTMEKTTFRDAEVKRELARFTVIRLQAEDPAEFAKLKDFKDLGIKGIPAFVIFNEK